MPFIPNMTIKKGGVMKIVAAAIKFRLVDSEYFCIMTNRRHADIFEQMHQLHIPYDRASAVQGFMTSTDQFVDRYEAKYIAVEADQLIVPEEQTCAELFSEDIW